MDFLTLSQIKKYVNKKIIGNMTYSEDEQECGIWLDNKKIYRKTIQLTAPTTDTEGTIASSNYDVEELNIGMLVNVDIIADTVSQTFYHGSNYIEVSLEDGHGLRVVYNKFFKQLLIESNTKQLNGGTLYITLQYTKQDS